jgi:ABC-type multidrug transport system fused ATPase/permease subunit
MSLTYPRYLILNDATSWSDEDTREPSYEIVRWDGPRTMVVVQANIGTYEKAHRALAQWKKRH